MIQLALLASMCVAEPPKEKYVSGIVTEVRKGLVTLEKAGAFRLSKDAQYLRETGRDPMEVGSEALDEGKSVTLTVVDGFVVRVFIDRFVPLTPDELRRFNQVIADERLNGLMDAMDILWDSGEHFAHSDLDAGNQIRPFGDEIGHLRGVAARRLE